MSDPREKMPQHEHVPVSPPEVLGPAVTQTRLAPLLFVRHHLPSTPY